MKKSNVLSVLEELEAIEKFSRASVSVEESGPNRLEEAASSVMASLDQLSTAVEAAKNAFHSFSLAMHEAVEEDSDDSDSAESEESEESEEEE